MPTISRHYTLLDLTLDACTACLYVTCQISAYAYNRTIGRLVHRLNERYSDDF